VVETAAPLSDSVYPETSVDWDELSGLDRIVAIFKVSANSLVVQTVDGREVRITAWLDCATGHYLADFERRSDITSGSRQLRVWAHTPAYAKCGSDDLAGCLEAAILMVDRVPVY